MHPPFPSPPLVFTSAGVCVTPCHGTMLCAEYEKINEPHPCLYYRYNPRQVKPFVPHRAYDELMSVACSDDAPLVVQMCALNGLGHLFLTRDLSGNVYLRDDSGEEALLNSTASWNLVVSHLTHSEEKARLNALHVLHNMFIHAVINASADDEDASSIIRFMQRTESYVKELMADTVS